MQFQFNSDYPGLSCETGQPLFAPAKDPIQFPIVQPIPCARLTTRIYHPLKNTVSTVQNVLVRTAPPVANNSNNANGDVDDVSWSDSDDDIMSGSSISTLGNAGDSDLSGSGGGGGGGAARSAAAVQTQQPAVGGVGIPGIAAPGVALVPDVVVDDPYDVDDGGNDRAYWVQRTIREAIYGRVLFAVVLKRRKPEQVRIQISNAALDPSQQQQQLNAEWEVTAQHAAVKELSWQHIRRERDRLAEDPIKEVAAMQYLRKWHAARKRAIHRRLNPATIPFFSDGVFESFRAILETNIMMPLDLLSDDRHLYSIMPYCDGGELFERLDLNERFTEVEARYWMHQLLNGLENLQRAGVCHRDVSLENLLVHESGALIIDLGMCLRIPLADDGGGGGGGGQQQQQQQQLGNNMMVANNDPLSQMMHMQAALPNMSHQQQQQLLNHAGQNGSMLLSPPKLVPEYVDARTTGRCLIRPQGTCGKWIYMSPEIYKNNEAFDGYAVDMWAAGVILFLMLTGFPPWERACLTDERFKYMSAGYLVQMLTEWQIGVTGDAMDLLQRMLFIDPKDRLSLDQVRAHPWMVSGQGSMTGPPSRTIMPDEFGNF